MANADDVAAMIVGRLGSVDTFKLQKLVYYSQAWSLVWDGRPIFNDRIEAWANGPVIPRLYQQHRQMYSVNAWPSGDPGALTPDERATVEAVLLSYGKLSGRQLIHLTHEEAPWANAREGLRPG